MAKLSKQRVFVNYELIIPLFLFHHMMFCYQMADIYPSASKSRLLGLW